jgi:hypothetical protein
MKQVETLEEEVTTTVRYSLTSHASVDSALIAYLPA